MNRSKLRDLTDSELVQHLLDQQSNLCFDELYARYSSKVYGKAISLLKDESIAQDVTQDIFVKIFSKIAKFQGASKLSTWIYSITYNTCIDYIRKQKRGRFIKDLEDERIEDKVEEVPDSELLEVRIDRLEKILELLPVEDKAILLMKYKDEMSIKDICSVTHKAESAVKMKIKRAKTKFVNIHKDLYKEVY